MFWLAPTLLLVMGMSTNSETPVPSPRPSGGRLMPVTSHIARPRLTVSNGQLVVVVDEKSH